MKVGDLVKAWSTVARVKVNDKTAESLKQFQMGIIVGFNKKGEGGKDFVHVLAEDGTVMMFNSYDIEVVNESR